MASTDLDDDLTPFGMENNSLWDDTKWAMGQLFMMGFDGTEVTPQIASLIQDDHVGTILLTAKNLKSAQQTTKLVLDLQSLAHDAGHPVPLAIALDQENGGVNSLFDEQYIHQFPSAMGVAATGSTEMAYEIAKATALELAAVGVNWIMGPVLDVLTNVKNQPLGVRSTGDDAEEVSRYGTAFMNGYKHAGLATCGKHFPSYGNLEFLGSSLDVPVIKESLDQLSLSALVPFRKAVSDGIDAMMVGGCAMSSAGIEVMHACLSQQVVNDLLRKDMGFDGPVVSECLEMEALSHNIGVGGGTIMAVQAGCDLVLVCRALSAQREAIANLQRGVEDGVVSTARIRESLRRVLQMKARCTSWERALIPGGIDTLSSLQSSHSDLSTKAYKSSITVMRDKDHLLPLSRLLHAEEELLILSPLVKPLPASATSRTQAAKLSVSSPGASRGSTIDSSNSTPGMSGEGIFQSLGKSIARQRTGRVMHTSYTANGLRPVHEKLIHRASAVVVLTADANRNLYQNAFTKHVAMICKSLRGEMREKPLVVISVSSPYDFALDPSIGTYVCTYDFTETALEALVDILFGKVTPMGALPGTINRSQRFPPSNLKQPWLVENWSIERDADALDNLIRTLQQENAGNQSSELAGCSSSTFLLSNSMVEESHFVVRNTSTGALYGFCSTYYFKSIGTGALGAILVAPERRRLSIGSSLHDRAITSLRSKVGIKRLQLGSRLPSVYLGIPSDSHLERKRLRQWFGNQGWDTAMSRPVCSMILCDLPARVPPPDAFQSVQDIDFEFVRGPEHADPIIDHIKTNTRQGVIEIYALAMANPAACGIIRAKRPREKGILASVIVYTGNCNWANAIPSLKDRLRQSGGISSPMISPNAGEYSTLLQCLIVLGVRYLKSQQVETVLLDHIDRDGNDDSLVAMGFQTVHSFEEVSADAGVFEG